MAGAGELPPGFGGMPGGNGSPGGGAPVDVEKIRQMLELPENPAH